MKYHSPPYSQIFIKRADSNQHGRKEGKKEEGREGREEGGKEGKKEERGGRKKGRGGRKERKVRRRKWLVYFSDISDRIFYFFFHQKKAFRKIWEAVQVVVTLPANSSDCRPSVCLLMADSKNF